MLPPHAAGFMSAFALQTFPHCAQKRSRREEKLKFTLVEFVALERCFFASSSPGGTSHFLRLASATRVRGRKETETAPGEM